MTRWSTFTRDARACGRCPTAFAFYTNDHAGMLANFTHLDEVSRAFGITHILINPGRLRDRVRTRRSPTDPSVVARRSPAQDHLRRGRIHGTGNRASERFALRFADDWVDKSYENDQPSRSCSPCCWFRRPGSPGRTGTCLSSGKRTTTRFTTSHPSRWPMARVIASRACRKRRTRPSIRRCCPGFCPSRGSFSPSFRKPRDRDGDSVGHDPAVLVAVCGMVPADGIVGTVSLVCSGRYSRYSPIP